MLWLRRQSEPPPNGKVSGSIHMSKWSLAKILMMAVLSVCEWDVCVKQSGRYRKSCMNVCESMRSVMYSTLCGPLRLKKCHIKCSPFTINM